jgi:cbb3-type cytochrome oxidase maturation protein
VISLALLAFAVWLFFRMSDSGQFDDVEGPARRILMDDDRPSGDSAELSKTIDRHKP